MVRGLLHDAHPGLSIGAARTLTMQQMPSSGASAIERWRLLDRVPLLLVRRDHRRDNVLVGPVLAAAVVLRPALLDADLGDEAHAVEVLEADRAGRACLRAHIVGLEPERGIEDGLERAATDFGGFGVPVGGAGQDQIRPKFALGVWSVDDDELAVEHLAIPHFAALEQCRPRRHCRRGCAATTVAIVPCGMRSKSRGGGASV